MASKLKTKRKRTIDKCTREEGTGSNLSKISKDDHITFDLIKDVVIREVLSFSAAHEGFRNLLRNTSEGRGKSSQANKPKTSEKDWPVNSSGNVVSVHIHNVDSEELRPNSGTSTAERAELDVVFYYEGGEFGASQWTPRKYNPNTTPMRSAFKKGDAKRDSSNRPQVKIIGTQINRFLSYERSSDEPIGRIVAKKRVHRKWNSLPPRKREKFFKINQIKREKKYHIDQQKNTVMHLTRVQNAVSAQPLYQSTVNSDQKKFPQICALQVGINIPLHKLEYPTLK